MHYNPVLNLLFKKQDKPSPNSTIKYSDVIHRLCVKVKALRGNEQVLSDICISHE